MARCCCKKPTMRVVKRFSLILMNELMTSFVCSFGPHYLYKTVQTADDLIFACGKVFKIFLIKYLVFKILLKYCIVILHLKYFYRRVYLYLYLKYF